jgi:RNA polymerase sigma-70 factor (ECF subfamily)
MDSVSATWTLMKGDELAVGPEAAGTRSDDPTAEDRDLVRLAQAGDEQAFARLVARHRRAFYRAAYAALGSAADADDVAQETFVSAFRTLGGFRGEAALKTWLLAIAWRKALDRRRSVALWLRLTKGRGRPTDDQANAAERIPSATRSPEEHLASEELARAVRQLVGTLPRKLRDVLLLAGAGDYTYEQIGQMLGTPVGTVKWRVSEARRVLRQKLTAMGHTHA